MAAATAEKDEFMSALDTYFKLVDENGNGKVEKEEYVKVSQLLKIEDAESEWDEFVRRADLDDNKTVELEEFRRFFTSLVESSEAVVESYGQGTQLLQKLAETLSAAKEKEN